MRALLAILAASSTLVLPGAAGAHTDACAGDGELVTSGDVYGVGVHAGVDVDFTLTLPTCKDGTTFTATGDFTGHCTSAFGSGETANAHKFVFNIVGVKMTLSGEVDGPLTLTPQFLEWCYGIGGFLAGADEFDANGVVTLVPIGH
jgi:hypothetical protein